MTFENLPSDWSTRPLDDVTLCHDVVDLCVSFQDRASSSMLTLYADEHDVPIGAPVLVAGVEWGCASAERREAVDLMTGMGPPAVLFGISSRMPIPEPTAQRWLEEAERACRAAEVRLLGFYSVDMEGIRQLSAVPSS